MVQKSSLKEVLRWTTVCTRCGFSPGCRKSNRPITEAWTRHTNKWPLMQPLASELAKGLTARTFTSPNHWAVAASSIFLSRFTFASAAQDSSNPINCPPVSDGLIGQPCRKLFFALYLAGTRGCFVCCPRANTALCSQLTRHGSPENLLFSLTPPLSKNSDTLLCPPLQKHTTPQRISPCAARCFAHVQPAF